MSIGSPFRIGRGLSHFAGEKAAVVFSVFLHDLCNQPPAALRIAASGGYYVACCFTSGY
jgi:hypothetical protein